MLNVSAKSRIFSDKLNIYNIMKIKILLILCLVVVIFIFAGCSSKFTFSYDDVKIDSITIVTIYGGDNKESRVNAANWNKLIEDLNGLNYKSYSGDIRRTSLYQIIIKFSTGDEEIIDANRIRRTDNKPFKFQCNEAEFKKVVEKHIN